MTDLKSQLSGQLASVRSSLDTVSGLLSEETVQSAVEDIDRIEERLSFCRGPLHIGLLGGTGVGKSTIINALARSEISTASDRRPHTDRIVVYRHEDQVIGEDLSDLVLQPHQTHDNDGIRDLVVYDLPDFDSVLPENRMRVLLFLEQLDVVVWVVSPEKYADEAMFEILRISPHNPSNFIFALNKIDQFMDASGALDHEKAARVAEDFRERLSSSGIEISRVYAISAINANKEGAEAGDFEALRSTLFQKRRDKEIRAIKLANVEQELFSLIERISDYPDTKGLSLSISQLIREVESTFEDLRERAGSLVRNRMDDQSRLFIRSAWLDTDKTGGLVMTVLRTGLSIQRLFTVKKTEAWEQILQTENRPVRSAADTINALRDRVSASLARFPKAQQSWKPTLEPDALAAQIDELKEKLAAEVRALFSDDAVLPMPGSRVRRIKHKLLITLPVIIMTIHLMNPDEVFFFLEQPAFGLFYKMLLNLLAALFETKGLVALVSLILIETVLSIVLAFGAVKRVDTEIDRFFAEVRERFESAISTLFQKYEDDLRGALSTLQTAVTELARLENMAKEKTGRL